MHCSKHYHDRGAETETIFPQKNVLGEILKDHELNMQRMRALFLEKKKNISAEGT